MESLVFGCLMAITGAFLGTAADILVPLAYRGTSLEIPERCASCCRKASSLDLIPLANGGRCHGCGSALPLRWLALPLAVASLAVAAYFRFEELGSALLASIFLTMLVSLAFTDIERRLLPDRIVLTGMVFAIATAWLLPEHSLLGTLVGGGVGIGVGLAFLVGSLPFGSGAFGMGDVKLLVLLGLLLGPEAFIASIFVSAVSASIAAALLLVLRLRRTGDYLPFGAYLAVGGVIGLFWGTDIWHWYARGL